MRITLLDEIARRGKAFTFDDLASSLNIERNVLAVILWRLEKRGWIERVEKGKYIIIPLGSEKGKYTLNEFVIGSLLVKPYAIAYWSALHHYGFTEQIPSTVFIETTSRRKEQITEIFGVRYQVVRVKESKFFGIKKLWIDEEEVRITDKEKTIIDCLDKPQHCGGIVEVAKALKTQDYDRKRLAEYGVSLGNSGVIRRLGYLCDFLNVDLDLPEISTRSYLYLDPTMPHKGERVAKWRIINNLDDKVLGELE